MFPPYAKYFSRIVFSVVGYHPYCVYVRAYCYSATAAVADADVSIMLALALQNNDSI